MSNADDRTVELQRLIDRANRGDLEARRELIHHAYERLRNLSAIILRKNFPRLKEAPSLVETTEVVNEVAFRLFHALEEIQPATVPDFFRLAARRIRWLLLDLAKQADRVAKRARDERQPVETYDNTARSEPPAGLAELYEQIEGLPTPERDVVDLLYFHGLTQTEAAIQMGITERTVRRYWIIARAKLFRALKGNLPPPAARITIASDHVGHA